MQDYILDEDLQSVNGRAVENKKVIIYQIMTRLFGNTNTTNKKYGTREENGVGKFNDISNRALQAIHALGITHVWYTGVLEHAIMADYRPFGIHLDDANVVKGRAGSPYAIKDYYDVNPDLAVDVPKRMQEFEALLQRTHDHAMKVVIDFIPNHVARAYTSDAKPEGVIDLGQNDDNSKSFSPNNNFYYIPDEKFQIPDGYDPLGPENNFITEDGRFEEIPAKVSGNDKFAPKPDINDWFETVKLNYGVDIQNNRLQHFDPIPDTWNKMRDILLFWANKGIDGFRCDMAEMVPVEFWSWVIPQIKEVDPDIIFIAEIYNPQAYRTYISIGHFDYLYDKVQLYDTLRNILTDKENQNNITSIWQDLRGINQYMLRFLENHDEQRIASSFFARDPFKAIPAMVVSATLYTGPVMLYFGQEVGEPAQGDIGFSGDDGRTTIFDYSGVPEHQKWINGGKHDGGALSEEQKRLRKNYANLLNFCKSSEAIAMGKLIDLHLYNQKQGNGYPQKLYAYLRFTEKEKLLVVVNFGGETFEDINVRIPSDAMEVMGLKEWDYGFVTGFSAGINTNASKIKLNMSQGDGTVGLNLGTYGAMILLFENKGPIR